MKCKYLAMAAILGGVTLFVWGVIWHAALPLYEGKVLFELSDSQTVNSVIQQNATHGNGVYYTKEGVLAVVAFTPDMADKMQNMGMTVTIEFITNVLVALLFAVIIGRTGTFGSAIKGALFMGLVGVTGLLSTELSYWNWYGFSAGFITLNIIGESLSWFVAGLVISALHLKINK